VAVLAFDASALDQPMPQANEHAAAVALEQCRDILQRRRARSGTSGQVRDLLVARIADAPPAERAAAELGLSARTLQRRLADEGTSYRALLDEVREQLAEELLSTGGLTVGEVARRLGYVEVSSFSQAFRRWKGVSPRAFRTGQSGKSPDSPHRFSA
jgi:AraC-like DNA-binding protein